MVDLNRVSKAKADLLRIHREIGDLIAVGKDCFLSDTKASLALKYLLIAAVEAIADLCQHLLAKTKGSACEGYVDCVAKAGAEGIIDLALAGRLRRLADLRNSLVHRYWIIEDARLFEETSTNLTDLPGFLAQVDRFLGSLPKP